MQIHVSELQYGDIVAEDVFNRFGLVVLPAKTVVGPEEIEKLIQHRIEFVTIDMREFSFQKKEEDGRRFKNLKAAIEPHFEKATQSFQDLFHQARSQGKIESSAVERSMEPLMGRIQHEKDAVSVLLALRSKDEYTFTHSVQVGVLSYYLSLWLGKSKTEAEEISVAGYLHDIGKSKIDEKILTKPSLLTEEEFELMKKHTVYGYSILKESLDNDLYATVALQHHERIDGSGYPHGLKKDEIHPVTKIVMVADIYSAMTSSRVYQEARDMLRVLKELYQMSFEQLDPVITHTFIRNMIPNFIGKKVTLSNGQVGQIVMTNPTDLFNPLIVVEGRFIDLSKNHELEIKAVHI